MESTRTYEPRHTTIFYMEMMQRALSSAELFLGWGVAKEFFAQRAQSWGDYVNEDFDNLIGTRGIV